MDAPIEDIRQDEILDELSELGLELARRLQRRALAAADQDDDAVLSNLSSAFHRVARAVRQTLALKDRLARGRRLEVRRAGDDAIGGYVARAMLRKGQVRAAVVRGLRRDYEYEHEYEPLLEALDDRIQEASILDQDFVDGPFEAIVERIRADLAAVANGADDPPPWRSSG